MSPIPFLVPLCRPQHTAPDYSTALDAPTINVRADNFGSLDAEANNAVPHNAEAEHFGAYFTAANHTTFDI
eukprot:gene12560-biopygen581